MKRKKFYSILQDKTSGLIKAEKQSGYEILVDGEKFYTYASFVQKDFFDCVQVYFIDPETGRAVFRYESGCDDPLPASDEEAITRGIQELDKELFIEDVKRARERKSYQLAKRAFRHCKLAYRCEERYFEEVHKEWEAETACSQASAPCAKEER